MYGIHYDPRPFPSISIPVRQDGNPPMDPMAQILQGFQDTLNKQDQDRMSNRAERERVKAMILVFISPRQVSDSVQSYVELGKSHVPQGQCYAAHLNTMEQSPIVIGSSDLPSSSLFPHAHMPCHTDHSDQHHGSDHASCFNEPPFLAVLTNTSHCCKFNK
jgi:hypothetical protein